MGLSRASPLQVEPFLSSISTVDQLVSWSAPILLLLLTSERGGLFRLWVSIIAATAHSSTFVDSNHEWMGRSVLFGGLAVLLAVLFGGLQADNVDVAGNLAPAASVSALAEVAWVAVQRSVRVSPPQALLERALSL